LNKTLQEGVGGLKVERFDADSGLLFLLWNIQQVFLLKNKQ